MPRKKRHEEHENLERWLVSYADFITLLFAFFVVMYSISSVNEGKYRVLSDTLSSAFNKTSKTLDPIQIGHAGVKSRPTVVKTEKVTGPEPSVIAMLRRTVQSNSMEHIAGDFMAAMQSLVDQNLIDIQHNGLWVEIEINTSLLFGSGSAQLEDEALPILNKLATVLKKYPNHLQVEGFTDNVPINTEIYPSNWELSAARAASVVHVFMNDGVTPDRMAAIGYGEYRPIADNATPEGRRKNRRVVLVILAGDTARKAQEIERTRATNAGAATMTAGKP